MSEHESVWRVPPFIEANVIDHCRPVDGVVEVMFVGGRAVDAPLHATQELMNVFGATDLSDLANMAVEVRSEPTVGFAQLTHNVHVGRLSEGSADVGPGLRRPPLRNPL